MAGRERRRRHHRPDGGPLYRLISLVVIFVCVGAALTLFFRVKVIEITGLHRYSAEEVQAAAEVSDGDNMFLLNKYAMAGRIAKKLPYVEEIRINRNLPDTLTIEVRECQYPLSIVQDGNAWLISSTGRIVDRVDEEAAEGIPKITGCSLLLPSVGTQLALATEFVREQNSLTALLTAAREAGMLPEVDGVRMEETCILLDYAGRFTIKLLYGADYAYKLHALNLYLQEGKIQENMTGTFDLTQDVRNFFQQDVR